MTVHVSGIAENDEVVAVEDFIDVGNILGNLGSAFDVQQIPRLHPMLCKHVYSPLFTSKFGVVYVNL